MSALVQKLRGVSGVVRFNKKGPKSNKREMDLPTMMIVACGLLCLTVPLELSQLSFGLVGAFAYLVVQGMQSATCSRMKREGGAKGEKLKTVDDDYSKNAKCSPVRQLRVHRSVTSTKRDTEMVGKQEVWKPSVQPVSAPSFSSETFERQVEELLCQIAPSAEGNKVVQRLATTAKQLLHDLFPEADVAGFACGDVTRGSAFSVAIPEIDIILTAPPRLLAERLQNRASRPLLHASRFDARTLQKSALRACTDHLVGAGEFKFRRSVFRGHEPKVVLVAPTSMGVHTQNVPISFSVNTVTPFYSVALLTECGQIDPCAKELILLVRRWAKDRGISHAAKGHLSPYLWTLMVVYFLQVSDVDNGPILPALGAFKLFSGLFNGHKKVSAGVASNQHGVSVERKSAATLFKKFVSFYLNSFSWQKEAISVRVGERVEPGLSLKFHVVVTDKGSADVAPCIEDPFDSSSNLTNHMTGVTIDRLREELSRAGDFFSRDASLAELLEPWTPDRDSEAER